MQKRYAKNNDSALNGSESHTKKSMDKLTAMLLPSVLCALVCMFLLCNATWAWFTSTRTGETTPIKTADYTITIAAKQGETDVALANNAFTAAANVEYEITLTASGTASTGFCVVSYTKYIKDAEGNDVKAGNEVKLYTQQIAPNDKIIFKVTFTDATKVEVTFTPQWGTSSKFESPDIVNNGTYP